MDCDSASCRIVRRLTLCENNGCIDAIEHEPARQELSWPQVPWQTECLTDSIRVFLQEWNLQKVLIPFIGVIGRFIHPLMRGMVSGEGRVTMKEDMHEEI
jgi:hypothetical protein